MDAEEAIGDSGNDVQSERRRGINERLSELNAGIEVKVEMYEQTPPLQIRQAFEWTQRNENFKKQKIDEAKKEATQILTRAAGSVYKELLNLLDSLEQAESENRPTEDLRKRLDRMLSDRVEGEANQIISDASAYHAIVVGAMQSDVELYRTRLPW